MPISEEAKEKVSRYFQHMAETRHNPLYAWKMLEFIGAFPGARSDPQASTAVPNWVFWYLRDVAEALCDMGCGHAPDSDARRVGAAAGNAITPAKALAKVSQVLRLASQGWNAFATYYRDELREEAWVRIEVGGEDREELQRHLGLTHERSLRRALRRARGNLPPRTKPLP
jgi:hypothetical protein